MAECREYTRKDKTTMNIFYLNDDPVISAEMHCDKHVVKMVIEYAQLLSTAHRIIDGIEYQGKTKLGRNIRRWKMEDSLKEEVLYKASHINHPSAKWVRENAIQYQFMYDMFVALCDEYKFRYGREHLTDTKLRGLLNEVPDNMELGSWSVPPQCMPDDVKVEPISHPLTSDNVITAYHKYYAVYKKDFAKWTDRPVPQFMVA